MVGMVISGQYFGWNYGFNQSTKSSYFIAVVILIIFFIFFMFSCAILVNRYADKDKSLADLVGIVLGRRIGYLTGWACIFEYWLGTPAIAISFAIYLIHFFPMLSYPTAILIAFAIVFLANIGALNYIAKFETAATVIAIIGVLIFYIFVIYSLGLSNHSVQIFNQPVEFKGIAYAIPFAIWLFLGIEGGLTLVHAMKKPKKHGFIGITIGLIILALLALTTVFLFTSVAGANELASDNPLPSLLSSLNFPTVAKVVLFLGLFGLLASFNGLTIGYSQQLNMLGQSYNLRLLNNKSHKVTKLFCLIIPLTIALICCLSNDLSQNFVIMSVMSALVVYLFVTISAIILLFNLKKYFLFILYSMILIVLIMIIIFTFIYAVIPANIYLFNVKINIIWLLSFGFIAAIISSIFIKKNNVNL